MGRGKVFRFCIARCLFAFACNQQEQKQNMDILSRLAGQTRRARRLVEPRTVSAPRRIPLIIHQIWMQGTDQVPKKYTDARASFVLHHPPEKGWKIETWDEARGESVLRKVAPDFGQTPDALVAWYKAIPKLIQRCDVLRCFLLYDQGGVYVDMDCVGLQSLTPLLDSTEATCDEKNTPNAFVFCETINNAVFASSPHNPIFPDAWWPEVYDAVSNGRQRMGWLARTLSHMEPGLNVVFTTGPMMWGRVLDGTGTVLFGGSMTETQKLEWGVVRPPHNAFYPRMSDAGRITTLTDRGKAQMVRGGSYTYHAQESDWLSGSVSMTGCIMAMTRTDMRRRVLVLGMLCIAVLIASIITIQIVSSPSASSVSAASSAASAVAASASALFPSALKGGGLRRDATHARSARTVQWDMEYN
jgi:hypothetical protein